MPEFFENVIQKSKYNIEILLIDDGSTDGSEQLCDDYASQYDNVKVFHKENGGSGSARNVGLQLATGEYVLFLDSDDYITIEALEDLYERSNKQKLDILLFGACSFFENEELAGNTPKQNYSRRCCLGQVCTGLEILREEQKKGQYITSICLRLYRLEYLRAQNRRFNEGNIIEDVDYSFFTLLNAERVEVSPQNYYHRGYRPGSVMTGSKLQKKFAGYERVWQEYFAFIENEQNDKARRDAAIKQSEYCIHNIFSIISGMNSKERRNISRRYKDILRMALKYASDYKRNTKLCLRFPSLCIMFFKTKKCLRRVNRFYRLIVSEPFWWIKLLNIKFAKRKKRAFLFGTPVHGNAREHLIALAEEQFIKKEYQEYRFIDLTMPFSIRYSKYIKNNIKDDDLIIISGGGWLGTEWPHNEIYVKERIREFKNNHLIL